MGKKHLLSLSQNQNGSILIYVVFIVMILTSLGLYMMSSVFLGIMASGTDVRDNKYFSNAESALKFTIANFNAIYTNNDNNDKWLYCSNQMSDSGLPVSLAMGDNGLIVASNNSMCSNSSYTPLRDMISPLSSGYVMFDYSVDGVRIARIEIKAIMLNPVTISTLSTAANNIPKKLHISPASSGYDSNEYRSRNYCITSTALDPQGNLTNMIVQGGVVAEEQKKSVDFLAGQ